MKQYQGALLLLSCPLCLLHLCGAVSPSAHTHRARAHSRPCVSLCACACTPPFFDALQATTPCAASAWTTTITLKQRVCKSARVRVLAHAAHDAEEAWRVLHACV